MKKPQETLKEAIADTFFTTKVCLTSFWFWTPILYAGYYFIQMWMFICVHPLTILILPIALSVYMVFQEEKRTRLQYGLDKKENLPIRNPLNSQELLIFERDMERCTEEYRKLEEKSGYSNTETSTQD
jgi:hypothetical protein